MGRLYLTELGSIRSTEFLISQILLLSQKAIEGFRFSPTEQELINYLKSEEPGHRGGFCIIPKLENITDFNPDDLPGKFLEKSVIPSNGRDWWFICPQAQNQRIRRKTPCGSSWGITGQPRDITIDGKRIGFKKILAFPYESNDKASKGQKSNWIIHEYHLPEDSPNSRNNVLCHLMKKQESPTRSEDGKFTLAEAERWYDQRNEKHVVEEGISPTLCTFSLPHLLQLLQREVESLSIHQSTNIGSSYGPYADFQNGEEPDKSIELESSLGNTEENVWADSFHSYTEVQQGEGPRLEKLWYSDEAAADRAKNDQIFIMENCRSKIKPREFSNSRAYLCQRAAQAKGVEHEEHNSPKRTRLDVSEENQTQ